MPRPKQLRRLSWSPPSHIFSPRIEVGGAHSHGTIVLTLDECESLRLADLECKTQEQAAALMGISRATFGRIVESARSKTAGALVYGRRLEIGGGAFVFGKGRYLQCPRCRRKQARGHDARNHVECRRCCMTLQHMDSKS